MNNLKEIVNPIYWWNVNTPQQYKKYLEVNTEPNRQYWEQQNLKLATTISHWIEWGLVGLVAYLILKK